MQIAQLIILILLAMIAGGWMATTVVFARGYKRMSAATYIEAEQTNSQLACKYFAPAIGLTVVIGIIYLLLNGKPSSTTFIMNASAIVLIAATGVFVKVKVLPLNDTMKQWSPSAPPANWQVLRLRWIRYHNMRTISGAIAFLLVATGIIWK